VRLPAEAAVAFGRDLSEEAAAHHLLILSYFSVSFLDAPMDWPHHSCLAMTAN
jgi:hypothetical protein